MLPAHTVLIGVRNLDEREKVAVRDSHVHVFTMKDIDRQGIASIVEQAVKLAGNGTAGIHVSFDSTSAIRRSRRASARRSKGA